MNKNITPLILIVLAIGIYFTFTRTKLDELKAIELVNDQYKQALASSEELIKKRDKLVETYNKITPDDQDRLQKIVPDNVDNVRLIIDINGVAAKHGLSIKNVKTSTTKDPAPVTPNQMTQNSPVAGVNIAGGYDTVTLSFSVSSNYQTFLNFLRDLEASLRILEISKISLKANESGTYDFSLEFKTFWLKQ